MKNNSKKINENSPVRKAILVKGSSWWGGGSVEAEDGRIYSIYFYRTQDFLPGDLVILKRVHHTDDNCPCVSRLCERWVKVEE